MSLRVGSWFPSDRIVDEKSISSRISQLRCQMTVAFDGS